MSDSFRKLANNGTAMMPRVPSRLTTPTEVAMCLLSLEIRGAQAAMAEEPQIAVPIPIRILSVWRKPINFPTRIAVPMAQTTETKMVSNKFGPNDIRL